jgi:hypothetical protein
MPKFKNEESIKDKIVECHRRGTCDSYGRSVRVTDSSGYRIPIARPRFGSGSVVKTYVYREGRMVLKNG